PPKRLKNALVMMPAGAVDVTVLALLVGGLTHIDDLDREMQRLACHRMIEVDIDDAGADLHDGHRAMAFLRAQYRAHSRLQPLAVLEILLRHALGEVVAAQTVG